MKLKIIRVGEKNNFNFTQLELEELRNHWEEKGLLFLNSNSFVSIKSDFPSIITINPYMQFVEPHGDLSNVRAARLKVVLGCTEEVANEERKAILWCAEQGIPILVTFMRFKRLTTMERFVHPDKKSEFVYNKGWIRPTVKAKQAYKKRVGEWLENIMDEDGSCRKRLPAQSRKMLYFCDESGKGCPSCNNCIRLTHGEEAVRDGMVWSLNLSASGDRGKCVFNCPDCWAKEVLNLCKNNHPACDRLIRNRKQRGRTIHE